MQKTAKISYLDGIRGVAAFVVFMHHFLLGFYPAYYSYNIKEVHLRNNFEVRYGQSLFNVFSNGGFAVCIFFVLSGFVLSRKYFSTNSTSVLVSGAQRRFLRLYIPVAFTLLISFILVRSSHYHNVPASHLAHSEWWFGPNVPYQESTALFFKCLTYSTMFNRDTTFDTSMWTMSYELYGSFVVFAFLALTHNTKKKAIGLSAMMVYFFFIHNGLFLLLVLGITLNYTQRSSEKMNKNLASFLSILLLIVSLILGSFPDNSDIKGSFFAHAPAALLAYSYWFNIIGGYLLVLAFVLSAGLQRFISMRLFRFLGYISFSLYLIHPVILSSFSSYTLVHLYARLGYNKSMIIVFLLTNIVCLAFSWLMTKYIDVPGTQFSKYIYEHFFKKSAVSQNESAIVETQDTLQ